MEIIPKSNWPVKLEVSDLGSGDGLVLSMIMYEIPKDRMNPIDRKSNFFNTEEIRKIYEYLGRWLNGE